MSMTAASPLFFVVRTDVSGDSGQQRCFGAFDTAEQASRLIAQIQPTLRGTFAIYRGAPATSQVGGL
jgi:hypothetical protein